MCPSQTHTAAGRERENMLVKYGDTSVIDVAGENIEDPEAAFRDERFLDLSL